VPESARRGEEAVQCDADDRAPVGVELVGELIEASALPDTTPADDASPWNRTASTGRPSRADRCHPCE
jgi:hypothetical protein